MKRKSPEFSSKVGGSTIHTVKGYIPAVDVPHVEFDWEASVPSFGYSEIFSPECLRTPNLMHMVDVEAIMKLQRFRDHIFRVTGAGLLVNFGSHRRRGVRSVYEQTSIWERYGVKNQRTSHHVAGRAFDVTMTEGHSSQELADRGLEFGWMGVGIYNSFVHLDTRANFNGVPTIWDKRS